MGFAPTARLTALLTYLALELLQFFGTMAAFDHLLGRSSPLSFILALLFGFFPVIGTFTGFYGAVVGWGWSALEAGLLFFGSLAAIYILLVAASMHDRRAEAADRTRRRDQRSRD
jgi:hypothetical protein